MTNSMDSDEFPQRQRLRATPPSVIAISSAAMQLIGSTTLTTNSGIHGQETVVADTPAGTENQALTASDEVDSDVSPGPPLPSDSSQHKRQSSPGAYYAANGPESGSRPLFTPPAPSSARESSALVAAVSQFLNKPSPSSQTLAPSTLSGDNLMTSPRGRASASESRKVSTPSSLSTVTWTGDYTPPGSANQPDGAAASVKPPIAGPGGSHWPPDSLMGDRPVTLRHYRRSHAGTQTDHRELLRVEELSSLVESMRGELDGAQCELKVMEDRMRAKQEDVVLARAEVEKRVKAKLSYLEECHAKKIEQLRSAHRIELNDAVNAAECRAKAEMVRIYEAKLATATNQNTDDKRRIAELEKELFLGNSQMNAIKDTVQQLEARVATQRSEMEQREAELDNIMLQKAKLSEKEYEIREMAKSIQRLESAFANQGQRNQALTRQVAELEKELARYRANEEAHREALEQERATLIRGFTQGERNREEDQNIFRVRLQQIRGDYEREKAVHEILLQRQSRAYEKLLDENAGLRAQLESQASESSSAFKRAQQDWDFERATLHKALAAANSFNAAASGALVSPRSNGSTPRGSVILPVGIPVRGLEPLSPTGKLLGAVRGGGRRSVSQGMGGARAPVPDEGDDVAPLESRTSLNLMYVLPSDRRVSVRALTPAEAMALHEASLDPLMPITVGRTPGAGGAVRRALEATSESGSQHNLGAGLGFASSSNNPGDVTFRGDQGNGGVGCGKECGGGGGINPGDVTLRNIPPHMSLSQWTSVSSKVGMGQGASPAMAGESPSRSCRGNTPVPLDSVDDMWRATRADSRAQVANEDGAATGGAMAGNDARIDGIIGGARGGSEVVEKDKGSSSDKADKDREDGGDDDVSTITRPSWLEAPVRGEREDPGRLASAQAQPRAQEGPLRRSDDAAGGQVPASSQWEGGGADGGQRRREAEEPPAPGMWRRHSRDAEGNGEAGPREADGGKMDGGMMRRERDAHEGNGELEVTRQVAARGAGTGAGRQAQQEQAPPDSHVTEGRGKASSNQQQGRRGGAFGSAEGGRETGVTLRASRLADALPSGPSSVGSASGSRRSSWGTDVGADGKPSSAPGSMRARDGGAGSKFGTSRRGKPVFDPAAAHRAVDGPSQAHLADRLETMAAMTELVGLYQGHLRLNLSEIAKQRPGAGSSNNNISNGQRPGGLGGRDPGMTRQEALVASWRGGAQTSRGAGTGNETTARGGGAPGELTHGTDASRYGDDWGVSNHSKSAGGPRSKGRRVIENGYPLSGATVNGMHVGMHGTGGAFAAPVPPGPHHGGLGLGLGSHGPSWPEAVGPATHHNPWTAQYAGR